MPQILKVKAVTSNMMPRAPGFFKYVTEIDSSNGGQFFFRPEKSENDSGFQTRSRLEGPWFQLSLGQVVVCRLARFIIESSGFLLHIGKFNACLNVFRTSGRLKGDF